LLQERLLDKKYTKDNIHKVMKIVSMKYVWPKYWWRWANTSCCRLKFKINVKNARKVNCGTDVHELIREMIVIVRSNFSWSKAIFFNWTEVWSFDANYFRSIFTRTKDFLMKNDLKIVSIKWPKLQKLSI
jgi:hypothetical protein